MNNTLIALVLCGSALVACGGGAPAATEPSSQTNTTTAPTGATPAAAAPATGECGAPKEITAANMDSCKADCQKLDDKAPAGSRCVPPRTQCMMNCDTKFKK